MFGPLPPPSRTIPVWASNGSPDTQVSPEMKKRTYLPKLVPLCPLMRSQALIPQLVPKSVIANTAIGDVTSHTPIWTSKSPKSLWRLLLSRSIRSELSRLRCHGHSLLLSSYLHRISRKRLLIVVPVDTLYRTSIISSSTVVLLNPFANLSLAPLSLFSIYGPDLGVWPDCWVSAEFLRAPHPSEGVG